MAPVGRRRLQFLIPAAAVAVLVGGGALAALETDTVESYWEGAWWALSLMTTVGFVGGIPHTVEGKLASAVLMVFGFLLLAMTTAAIASLFVREDEEPEEKLERSFEHRVLEELSELRAQVEQIRAQLPLENPPPGGRPSAERLPDD